MCGIAGLIGRLDEANAAALQRMSAAMIHRGPDADGTWQSLPDEHGRGVMLAHRRLAILDLSPAGVQPMLDRPSGDAIVFNGEIYNYVELRRTLGETARDLQSTGDTAVMLRALATRGTNALPLLRGMFAIGFWDDDRRVLTIARDPLGIKPLYLLRNPDPDGPWSLAFASEVRALLASGLIRTPRLDPRAAASMIWNGFVIGPGTAVHGVELLDAGCARSFDSAGREVGTREFWSVPTPGAATAMGEEELAAVLEENVRLHLASDVPLAVFLSGGIDSSAMANLAQRTSATPIHTFTLAFEEQELNEGPFARRIAEAIGTEHHEVVLTGSDFRAHLEPALDSLDQPTFDGLNAYFMSRAIRQAGFTVAISGTGGDELFGGYSSFRDLPVLHRWMGRLRNVPRGALVGAAQAGTLPLRLMANGVPPQTRWAKLPEMVRRGDELQALYQLAYALFLPDFQRELLREPISPGVRDGIPDAMGERLRRETRGRSPLAAISVMEQRLFLGERLLRDNDVASMASSLEQRVPLVDQVLFEAVARLPDPARYLPVGRKQMLRRIGLRGLDPAIFERPKSGFVLPFDRWIRDGLRTPMDATLRDPEAVRAAGLEPRTVEKLWHAFLAGAPGLYWSRIWTVYALVRWCQRNGVTA